jgi:glycosyltransferase involved in cell wall biosynthesis
VNYNGLSSNVSFKGEYNKTQLIDAYKKASIFCLMSYNESFALSRLEAISFDDYVISSNAGCAKDFLKYGIKIVEAGNVNGLVNAISNYIENGKNFNSRISPKIPTYEDIARKISDPEF